MTKCIKCGAEATVRFSTDLDIYGIGACEEHRDEIIADLYIAFYTDDWKRFNKKYNNNANSSEITK